MAVGEMSSRTPKLLVSTLPHIQILALVVRSFPVPVPGVEQQEGDSIAVVSSNIAKAKQHHEDSATNQPKVAMDPMTRQRAIFDRSEIGKRGTHGHVGHDLIGLPV